MSRTITIVTSNKGKIHSLTNALEGLDVQVESQNLNLREPQCDTIEAVARYKATMAFVRLKKPVVVHDGGLVVPALKGFPGVYTKYISDTLTPQDFINLMKDKEDKTCYLTQTMIYLDENGNFHQFQDKLMGKIADTVSPVDNDKRWGMLWQIFVPKGSDKPLAEIPEDVFNNEIRPIAKTNSVWEDFKSFLIKTYNIQTTQKKTPEVMANPVIPEKKEETAPLKKEELPTDKGQELAQATSSKTSKNEAQTSEENAFEKWLDKLGELVERGDSEEIKRMFCYVFRDNEGFVFNNKFSGEKSYFSKEDINKQNKFGHTLAMILAQYASPFSSGDDISLEAINLLKDVDCQKKDKDGRTVLHYYCQNKWPQYAMLVEMAKDKRFDFYERDVSKMSPLLYLFSGNEVAKLEYINLNWLFIDSKLLKNNFSRALDADGNNFLITLLKKYNWKSEKSAKSDETENDDDEEYKNDLIEEITQAIVSNVPDLSCVQSKDGLSLIKYIKKHNLKEFCEYLAENARDKKMAEQAKKLFLNTGNKKTTAKKEVKRAGTQKGTSKKEVKKTPQKEAEKATDKKTSAQKTTSKSTPNKPAMPQKIATQAPKKRVVAKGRSKAED